MYIANHYVKIDGTMYVKGEIIPEGVSESKIKWLLSAGAIHADAPAEEPVPEPGTEEAPDVETEEAPEVDVMAGIVSDGAGDKPTQKSTRRRKGN